MSDLQAIADRVQIEALRGEATDAAMMRDYDRVASLFTHDGVARIPHIGAEAVSYLDHSALAGSAPSRGALADPLATGITAAPDRSSRAVMEEEVT
jgi:hypothetical protein